MKIQSRASYPHIICLDDPMFLCKHSLKRYETGILSELTVQRGVMFTIYLRVSEFGWILKIVCEWVGLPWDEGTFIKFTEDDNSREVIKQEKNKIKGKWT
jgi:hypothetical protein